MASIKIRFASRWPYNIFSLLIARLSGSKQFSHVMLIIDGAAYEASMLHGVRVVPIEEAMDGVVMYQDMEVPIDDVYAAEKWAKEQLGKGYDFAGAFGIPFLASDDWNDDSKWWCSEYVFMIVGAGGVWMLDKDEETRVTPNDLHQCNYHKSEVVYVKGK